MEKPYVAWIESGAPADGVAFLNGLRALGWENLLTHLEPGGFGRLDKAHPELPIRAIGGQFLVKPGENDYKKANLWPEDIARLHEFLSLWLFSPLLDPKRSLLTTTGGSELLRAKIIGISGHGSANLEVWGDADPIDLAPAISEIAALSSLVRASPAYLLLGACSQLRRESALFLWSKAFRQANPLHGVLGYQSGYPDAKRAGGPLLDKFTKLLGAGETILDAWRISHEALNNICPSKDDPTPCRERWAALLHKDAIADTLKSIVEDNRRLDPDGELYYYDFQDFPEHRKGGGGRPNHKPLPDRNPPPSPINAKFKIDNVEVTPELQRSRPLMPSPPNLALPSSVVISIESVPVDDVSLAFLKGDKIRIIFNLYRENKVGLDVTKLFDLRNSDNVNLSFYGKSWEPLKPLVNERGQHFPFNLAVFPGFREYDAFEVTCPRDGTQFDIHLVLNRSEEIFGQYPREGMLTPQYDHHGYFWVRVMPPRVFVDALAEIENKRVDVGKSGWTVSFVTTGVWLAGPPVREERR